MNDPRHQRISEIFLEACVLEGVEREALLAERCGDDAELRAAVEALLSRDTTEDNILDEGALEAGLQFGAETTPPMETHTAGEIPRQAGRYR